MSLNKRLLFIFYVFLFLKQQSQNPQNAIIDKIDSRTLSNSFISSLFQDQKGYLWVGTLAGLNKYDGYTFEKYLSFQGDSTSLSNPVITCLHQLNNDKILVGTRKGLNIYNYRTNTFQRVKTDTTEKNFKRKNNIVCITSNLKGEKIIGTADGVYLFNEQNSSLQKIQYGKSHLLEGWLVQSMCFDRLGVLWAGVKKTINNAVVSRVYKCEINKLKMHEFSGLDGGTNGFLGISEDYLGNIWLGVDDGLVSIATSNLKVTKYKAPNGFYSSISYTHSKDNTIWQCYWSFGLTAFDIDKKEFKIYQNDPDNSKSLMSNKCWALCKDENDILWIGSDVGLQKLTSRKPNLQVVKRSYQNPSNSFLNNIIISVLASKKHNNLIYVGVDGEGFSLYNQLTKTTTNFGPNAQNKNDERFVNQFIEDDSGNVYIGGQNLFQKLTITKNNTYSVKSFYNQQEHYIANIIKNPDNPHQLVMGGIGEIIIFDQLTEKLKYISQPLGVKSLFISNFAVNNYLYFTYSGGIIKFNAQHYDEIEDIKLPDVGDITNAVTLSDTVVLLSSKYLGLLKFNPKTYKYAIVYKGKNNFFKEIKSAVIYKNCYWMATDNGLIKWNYTSNEITEITSDDGLPTEIIHQLDFLDGYFYIATQEGLVIFNPDYQVSHFNLPKIDVTRFEGLGNSFSIKNLISGQEIELKESQNSFRIDFTVLDFNLPEKNRFKFRFLPYDKEWQQPLGTNFVIYNDLPAGTYRFELMGANADQIWCADPFILTIKVVPPFYRATWFKYLVIILIVLIIVLFVYLRVKAARSNRIRLERIIKQRTAEIQQQRAELMDSISYAERIQRAIFVGQDTLKANIKNSFIYYKPKDQVSGDFFWVGKHKDILIIFAGDCTGHGVPGAMLSIVGTSLLNKIVYEENLYLPGEILTRLNHLFYHQLNLKEDNIRDGMDASIIALNLVNNNVYYAGAKNDASCIINNSLIDLKAHRYSIGENDSSEFKTTFIPYEPNRSFYLFSDGVKDQFGGTRQKKFSAARFKQTILQASDMPFDDQSNFIQNTVNTWQGVMPQTDDIMVIGFKF
ncbi:MAG: SpoIIE family protein phosphatase [Bacteroidota bacterium]|nr:SpoIIE family protein phosphatase [Bacteroidota bacterium]